MSPLGAPCSVLLVLLCMTISLRFVLAIECRRPWTSEECNRADFRCDDLDPAKCLEGNGTYLERGSTCGACNICAKYVGIGKLCNSTSPLVIDPDNVVTLTLLCEEGLVCTESGGICVPEERCSYPE